MRSKKNIPNRGPSYAFIVEGECEFWYIQMLKRNERSLRVDLKPEIPQKKKLIDQFEKVIQSSEEYDKVFWIIDFDVIIKESRETRKGVKTPIQFLSEYLFTINKSYSNITVIINNPCLEFWILLHFEQTGKYFNNCENAITQLKKKFPNYEKTRKFYTKQDNDIYLRLKENLPNAIANSKKLGHLNLNNPETAICQMYKLFDIKDIKDIIYK